MIKMVNMIVSVTTARHILTLSLPLATADTLAAEAEKCILTGYP